MDKYGCLRVILNTKSLSLKKIDEDVINIFSMLLLISIFSDLIVRILPRS